MLELIDRGCTSSQHPVPLVFVHGAWHAAWCWEENFLGYFADRGYHAVAVNLRGHGGRPARQSLNRCSIADYVGDVGEVADRLSVAPVVIGHSMGGLIVQKYLETRRAPAGVLLASVPTRGATGFLLRWARQHPWKVTKSAVTRNSLSLLDTEEAVRDRFFSATTPDEVVAQCADRLQEESSRASWDGALLNLPRPKRITAPLLVMGAEQDGCFTTAEVHATARAYRTKAEIFPGMGHDMMLEPAWPTVAERIDAWLVSNGL